MIDYENFRKALKNLESYWGIWQNAEGAYIQPEQERLNKMGLVQGFEICLETAFKALHLYLKEELQVTNLGTGKNPIIRAANENNLLSGTPEQWMEYVKIRNSTSHDYIEKRMEQAIDVIQDFIKDCIGVYETLTKEKWR